MTGHRADAGEGAALYRVWRMTHLGYKVICPWGDLSVESRMRCRRSLEKYLLTFDEVKL